MAGRRLRVWKRRLRRRKRNRDEAKQAHVAAQETYEKAKRRHLPPVAKARDKRDRALGRLRELRGRVKVARRQVRKRSVPPLVPERTRISPNHSSRGGVKPRLIVLHITVSHNRPGMSDVDGILSYFAQPGVQASSHIVNDREGHDARCVRDADKAWTQAAYNPQALAIEQIEYSAGRTREQWLGESAAQLENTARWVAHWSKRYGIPIVHSTSRGVCQHMELGAAGGGHSDCGPGYPLDYVLAKAREYAKHL